MVSSLNRLKSIFYVLHKTQKLKQGFNHVIIVLAFHSNKERLFVCLLYDNDLRSLNGKRTTKLYLRLHSLFSVGKLDSIHMELVTQIN